ncbi:MAG: Thivi_2564 family membrane protein [Candidatus Tumulicola sp.]
MPIIEVCIVLVVVGVLLWLVNTYIPMAAGVKSLLNAVVIIFLIVWLLRVFGLWNYITHLHAS